jgi:integrase
MPHATALAFPEENLIGWERAMIAFLVEKERRSGSRRTVEGYSRMLQHFFARVPKAPDKVTAQEVFRMTVGDLSFDNEVCFYSYKGKGGKTGRRELPRPALDAIRAELAAYGRELEHTCPAMNRCGPLRPPRTERA